jgi:hypothetical protein
LPNHPNYYRNYSNRHVSPSVNHDDLVRCDFTNQSFWLRLTIGHGDYASHKDTNAGPNVGDRLVRSPDWFPHT